MSKYFTISLKFFDEIVNQIVLNISKPAYLPRERLPFVKWAVIDIENVESFQMGLQPFDEVGVILVFRLCPDHLGQGAISWESHIFGLLRIRDVFQP